MKKRVISFGAVGIFNTLLNIIMFNIFVYIGFDVGLSNFISICISIAIAFVLASTFVFNDRTNSKPSKSQFFKFLAVNIFTLFIIHQIVLLYFAYVFTLPGTFVADVTLNYAGDIFSRQFIEANTAKALAVVASMVVSYVLYDKFVFKQKEPISGA
jgi:putative flippase GtrA